VRLKLLVQVGERNTFIRRGMVHQGCDLLAELIVEQPALFAPCRSRTIAAKKKREQEEILLPFLVPWSLATWPPLGIRDGLAGGPARRLGLPNGIEVSAEPATTINTNSYV
jgi:hypothetical protein